MSATATEPPTVTVIPPEVTRDGSQARTFRFTTDQIQFIDLEARARGVSHAGLVREVIDGMMKGGVR